MGEDNRLIDDLMCDVAINTLVTEEEVRAMMEP